MKTLETLLEAYVREILLEASIGKNPAAQAGEDDPYGKYLFAKMRKDLKGTPAAKEKDTPEEAELYSAFDDHYNNREYTLGDSAEQLLDLVKQGKYAKLLAPPPGPYYRVISDVSIPVLCKMIGIDRKSVAYGKVTRTKGGVMTPGGDMAGSTGIHSWSTALDPSWVEDDLYVTSYLTSHLRNEPAAIVVLRASGGKNFFANPEGMKNVAGLGKYVERQDEVISYGPVKFSAAAYWAGKKLSDAVDSFDIEELIGSIWFARKATTKTLEESVFEKLLTEASALPQRFYHGSSGPLKIGTVLGGRKFKSNFGDAEKILEAFRPADMVSRVEAVYMTGWPGDISLAGGETDYVYLLEPLDTPQKHHGGWLGEIYDVAMREGDDITKTGPKLKASTLKRLLPQLETAASAYWSGRPFKGSGEVWEYLCRQARVVKEVKY